MNKLYQFPLELEDEQLNMLSGELFISDMHAKVILNNEELTQFI